MPFRAYMKIVASANDPAWIASLDKPDSTSATGGFSAAPGMDILAFDFQARWAQPADDPNAVRAQQTQQFKSLITSEIQPLVNLVQRWTGQLVSTRPFEVQPPPPAPVAPACLLDPLSVVREVDDNSAWLYKLAFVSGKTLKVTISVSPEAKLKTEADASLWQIEFSEAMITGVETLAESALLPFSGKRGLAAPASWSKAPWVGPLERIRFDFGKIKWGYAGVGAALNLQDAV
ncbi:MAG TPA: type VI secretion system tube protein Hcp [Planctomycetaceae bacterium]|nr:type VI secretion system tube protein Hcp [Planctomycetaceae bacterium]